MNNEERRDMVLSLLDRHYPQDVKCFLDYETPWQLLIATILSAQCTDDRVNLVTKDLFRQYSTVRAFAETSQTELEKAIYSTGFYRNKAKNIIACCRLLLEKYDGQVPSDIDQLTELPGVGRKTANVIRGNIYQIPSVVVDTHVKRVSYRLEFTAYQDPVKIEFELMDFLPREHWIRYNTQVISHGRQICKSQKPKCEQCFLLPYCPYGMQLKNHV